MIYTISEAVDIIIDKNNYKFNESIDIDIRFEKFKIKNKESLKGYLLLPNKFNEKKIAIIDTVSTESYNSEHIVIKNIKEDLKKINRKKFIFITNNENLIKLGNKVKILKQKKLLPDPVMGTLTTDIKKVIGKLENYVCYQSSSFNIRLPFANVKMPKKSIMENYRHVIENIIKNRKQSWKNARIKKISISSTMGKKIDLNKNE